jgi:hypothetical protein
LLHCKIVFLKNGQFYFSKLLMVCNLKKFNLKLILTLVDWNGRELETNLLRDDVSLLSIYMIRLGYVR